MRFGAFGAVLQDGEEIWLRLKPAREGDSRDIAFDVRHTVLKVARDAKKDRVATAGVRNTPLRFGGACVSQLEAPALECALRQVDAEPDQPGAIDI